MVGLVYKASATIKLGPAVEKASGNPSWLGHELLVNRCLRMFTQSLRGVGVRMLAYATAYYVTMFCGVPC